MNKRQRLEAVLRGEVPDRVPASVWLHDFTQEHSARALADESVRLCQRFDLDLLKPQSRAQSFGQMWGLEFTRSTRPDEWPVVTRFAVQNAGDLAKIGDVDGRTGALGEQIEAMRLVRNALGADMPIVATVFAPMMCLALMHQGGMPAALELQRSAPDALEAALRRMSRTLAQFASACIDAGVDGIFYATTTANAGQANLAEHQRFQRPFDLEILAAAQGGWANILHLCGNSIQAPWFAGYPAQMVSWATTPGNPGFDEMRALTGKTLLAGMPGKPAFAQMSADELKQHVARSLAVTGGVGHVLGPDCSINPGTPEALIAAAFEPVRSFRPQRR